MKDIPSRVAAATLGFMIGCMVAYSTPLDPKLDACAREHNVYACEYVPQPINSKLLPPPAGGAE